jgi:general secretion pathway protein A
VALPLILYLAFSMKVPSVNVSVAALEGNGTEPISEQKASPDTKATPDTTATPDAKATPDANATSDTERIIELPLKTEILTTEKAELIETARLLTVLLDSGRVVVGRVQPAINNPRLEDKGFSSTVFEGQLRKEFQTRTGHDLRNLAPAAMPESAKPLLVRLAYFMQKAVQDGQPLINKKGIGFKGFIPATFGTSVSERFSKDTGLKLRQIGPPGNPPRNPNNKPDSQEEQALLAIQKSHPRIGDHAVEQQLPDNAVRVLLPLFYNKQCLGCHGKPKGEVDISGYPKEGFKEGDLGGAISITLPASKKVSKGERG